MARPGVSVVVPTHNRPEKLARLLYALGGQEGAPAFEVVVSDDRSTDDSVARVRGAVVPYPLEVVTSERNTGPAGARNRGW
ncbi:MAG: glycosyltransferase family 2 protein, partial [Acidimicrobiales bacterium]